MITESSSYVLISAFPNNVTSVLDGDLPAEVAPVRACTVSDSCSNIAVRCRCVSSCCFKQNSCLPHVEREKTTKVYVESVL